MNDKAVSPVIGVILMVAILVILTAAIAAFVFGMSGSIRKEIPAGYVSCSDYYHILDKWKTPSGFYVRVEGKWSGITDVSESNYANLKIGGYGDSAGWGIYSVNLTPVNESVSGMRDACKVTP